MGILGILYLFSGLHMFYAALQYISYIILLNINPLVNTDIYWCYADIISRYRGNSLAELIAKVYAVCSMVFMGYLLYISCEMISCAFFDFTVGRKGGWGLGNILGVFINAYVVGILLHGIYRRLIVALKPEQHPL